MLQINLEGFIDFEAYGVSWLDERLQVAMLLCALILSSCHALYGCSSSIVQILFHHSIPTYPHPFHACIIRKFKFSIPSHVATPHFMHASFVLVMFYVYNDRSLTQYHAGNSV